MFFLCNNGIVNKCTVGKSPKSESKCQCSLSHGLSNVPFTVFHRWQSHWIVRIYPQSIVVNKYISEDNTFYLLPGKLICCYLVNLFFFERCKETLHPGVVKAMPGAAEALDHSVLFQFFSERFTGILAATVRMQYGTL